jgi:D-lactate dehydrogenase
MPSETSLIPMLRKLRVFSTLDDDMLNLLGDKLQPLLLANGDILCREGEPGDRLYLIETGEVAVTKQNDDGDEVEVARLRNGDIAGELSLFGPSARSATMRAANDTTAWVLDYTTFQDLVMQQPQFAQAMLAYISSHLRRETSVVAKLLSRDMDRRLKVAFFDTKTYMEDAFRVQNNYDITLQFFEPRLNQQTVSLAAGFQVVCVFVNDLLDAELIEELHDLGVEMIALRCAGYNNVDLDACKRCGITVTRVPGYSPHAVAEHAVALMLALNRHLPQAHHRIREGNFSLDNLVGFDMYGKTVGVVGTGKIGRCALEILAGFGCHLLAYDKYPDKALANRLNVRFVEFDELLTQSDIISLHAPLTPDTHHLINATSVDKMKVGVMLINTGRGALIDTQALIAGLKSGKIGYAGLDVYEEESGYFFEDFSARVLSDDVLARLTTFNNVLISSHQGFLTREALDNIARSTLDSIHAFTTGQLEEGPVLLVAGNPISAATN